METKTNRIRQIVSTLDVPDGVYSGVWGGYLATFQADGKFYEVGTVEGIRTISQPCEVIVADGQITVRAK